jgi:MFS family permease
MMPLALFRSRAFSVTNAVTLLLYAALGGALFFVPMNLIQVQGFTATEAGAALVPSVTMLFLLSRWAGGLASRIGARLLLVAGPAIAAAGFGLFTLPGVHASYWTGFFPAFVVLGLGMALTVAPLTTTVMSSVGRAHSGIASGINNAISEAAGLLAVAVFGLAMGAAFETTFDPAQGHAVTRALPDAFIAGFRCVMGMAAGLALLSAVCAGVALRGKHTGERP